MSIVTVFFDVDVGTSNSNFSLGLALNIKIFRCRLSHGFLLMCELHLAIQIWKAERATRLRHKFQISPRFLESDMILRKGMILVLKHLTFVIEHVV